MEEVVSQESVSVIEPISWQAEEFETYRRDWRWYAIFVLVWAGGLFYTFYVHQWILLAMTVVVGLLLLFSNRFRPRLMQYQLDEQGLRINEKTFAFTQLKGFWFHDKPGKTYVNLISTFRLMPAITLAIQPSDQARIKALLGQFLPEMNQKDEDWIDKINQFLKV